jgi:hypothetical protein
VLRQGRRHLPPRIGAGPKTVKKDHHRLALPPYFVVDLDSVNLDKAAVSIGQLIERHCIS